MLNSHDIFLFTYSIQFRLTNCYIQLSLWNSFDQLIKFNLFRFTAFDKLSLSTALINSRYQLLWQTLCSTLNCFWSTDIAWAISNRRRHLVRSWTFGSWHLTNHISRISLHRGLGLWHWPITQKLRPYMCWHIWIFMISMKSNSIVSITHKRCEFGATRRLGIKHDLLYLILT